MTRRRVGRPISAKMRDIKKMPELRPKRDRPVRLSEAYPRPTYNRISRKGSITKKPRWG